jgi:hypothetical protein
VEKLNIVRILKCAVWRGSELGLRSELELAPKLNDSNSSKRTEWANILSDEEAKIEYRGESRMGGQN